MYLCICVFVYLCTFVFEYLCPEQCKWASDGGVPEKPLSLSFVCLRPYFSYLPISIKYSSTGFLLYSYSYLYFTSGVFVRPLYLSECLFHICVWNCHSLPCLRLGLLPGSTLHLTGGIHRTSVHSLVPSLACKHCSNCPNSHQFYGKLPQFLHKSTFTFHTNQIPHFLYIDIMHPPCHITYTCRLVQSSQQLFSSLSHHAHRNH